MNHQKKLARISFVLGICFLCGRKAYAGTIQNQIQNTGERINQLEESVSQTDKNISTYEKEQRELEQQIFTAQEKISRLSNELDRTKAAAEDIEEETVKTKRRLSQSQKEQKEQYIQMKRRIQFMYENSRQDMLIYVLQAGSMPEALRRANYFQAVISYDREKMKEYKAVIRKIKRAEAELVSEKEELEELEKQQLEQLSEIDGVLNEMKASLSSKIFQIQQSRAMRSKYKQDLEKQIKYEQELERQKAQEDLKRAEEIKRQEQELARQKQEAQARQEQARLRQEAARQQSGGNGSDSSSGSGSGSDSSSGSGSHMESGSSLELLSAIIYCEAGNQPYEGQLAVGSVIMNRVESSSFPNSISGVIYQSGQFSPVSSGRFARALASGAGRHCKAAAREVLNGTRNVSCLYFCADNGLIDGTVIGDHVFY